MKQRLIITVLTFAFILNAANFAHALPVVLKTSKTVSNDELTELFQLDTSKFRQIRIAIKYVSEGLSAYGQAELNRAETLLKQGVISQNRYDETKERLLQAGSHSYTGYLNAIEDSEKYLITELKMPMNGSIVIDAPPSKTAAFVIGKGKYSVVVWGQ